MTEKVQAGDTIRILVDGLSSARVQAGDELVVISRVADEVFRTESPRQPSADGWWFSDTREGEGWERA